ncbi:MAG: phospholipase D-like domain-containing protein [Balneolaceae bacterium]
MKNDRVRNGGVQNKCFEELLNSNVDLWYYQKTMLHAKIITIDGVLSCVGSANFNHRSMLKDDEINVVILDEEITGQLNTHFEEDLTHSEKIKEGSWKKRGLIKRSIEKASRLITRQI